jgi:chaperone LolA
MKKLFVILALFGLSLSSAHAAVDVKKHAANIARVEAYLSQLSSIQADFTQVAPSGELAEGKFFLKRPGKMRWQYAPPTPILLVSNGKTVTFFDSSLDQVNYISLDDTLAGFLAQKDIRLHSKATELVAFESMAGVLRATIRQRGKPEQGSLMLEFQDRPLVLKNMRITDASGNTTSVQLQNASFGVKLPEKLFVFEDPRGVTPRKRN